MERSWSTPRLLAGCVGVALWASGGTVPAGDGIEFEAIFRANGDGSAVEQVLPSNVVEAQGTLAVGGQHLYWHADFFCCNSAEAATVDTVRRK